MSAEHRRRRKAIWIPLLGACLLAPLAAGETVTFRQGDSGYVGTEDLHLAIPEDFMGTGHRESEFQTDPENPRWEWDGEDTWGEGSVVFTSGASVHGWGDNVGLLRFRNIFGDSPDQVPPGARITSAILELHATQPEEGDPANLHRVLVDWDESTRWNDFGPAPGLQMGTDYGNEIAASTGTSPAGGGPIQLDVTASVQNWSDDPGTNRGWILLPAGTQDTISIPASAIENVAHVSVDLEILTPARGELVVTLRKGDYTAVLLNRIGRATCNTGAASTSDDLAITLDDDAAVDVHHSGAGSPLAGTWKPDGFCVDLPLCTPDGSGGLCGGPASGDWVLTVTDEWLGSGSPATLASWSLTLSDGVGTDEFYESTPQSVIPKRHGGTQETSVHSSEASDVARRPTLTIEHEPTLSFSPPMLEASPGGGVQTVDVRIPSGANSAGPVSVSVVSDAPGVATPLDSPLIFSQGGPTTQSLQIAIGASGPATLATSNDASLGDARLPVSIATGAVQLAPAGSYLPVGVPGTTVIVRIPPGSNDGEDVSLTLTSSDPSVAAPLGGTAGVLPLTFAAGSSNEQAVSFQLGSAPGSASISVSEDSGAIAQATGEIVLSSVQPVEYDVNVEPYVQLGDPQPGASTDSAVVAWQTITRRTGGSNADRFTLEYRRVGAPDWISAALAPAIEYGSVSRLNHAATLDALDLDSRYEYRLMHLRNESVLSTYSGSLDSRPSTGGLHFTAFGNSGQGTANARAVAELLSSRDTSLHLLLGDMVYDLGEYEHHKPRINQVYGDLMRSRPFVATMGNHEMQTDSGRPVLDHFFLPRNGPPGLEEEHYSFDRGDVHFASINSALDPASMQAAGAWLRADLAASGQPWKVVYTHEPPLTLDSYGIDRQASAAVRDHLLSVAVEEGAQLFLAGAVHSYQRYLPVTSVLGQDPWLEWSACPSGPGTTLVYPGTGAWTRSPPGPVPLLLDPPMQVYEPTIGLAEFQTSADALAVTFLAVDGTVVDSIVLPRCPGTECACTAICGDGFVQAPQEECDDGALEDGDGCSSSCQYETVIPLAGVAEGGFIALTLGGVPLLVPTSPGELPAEVAAAIAQIARFDPALILIGIEVVARGDELRTNGQLESLTIQDPGLSLEPPAPAIPALPVQALAVLVLILMVTVVRLAQPGSSSSRPTMGR